jgi:hypothetical protein
MNASASWQICQSGRTFLIPGNLQKAAVTAMLLLMGNGPVVKSLHVVSSAQFLDLKPCMCLCVSLFSPMTTMTCHLATTTVTSHTLTPACRLHALQR